jgi:hypothetical protein
VVGKTVGTSFHQFAGDDKLRAADLQWALDDPSIKAVFAARGGYGCVRIVDQIDFSRALKKIPNGWWVLAILPYCIVIFNGTIKLQQYMDRCQSLLKRAQKHRWKR